jgi:ADP-ribose pyrophosphatase YjhB (NUDIX family)
MDEEAVPQYALHALLGIADGHSDEATVECSDLDDALDRIRQAVDANPSFVAISLLHAEDLPRSLEGASKVAKRAVVDVLSHRSEEPVRSYELPRPGSPPVGCEHGITAVALVLRGPLLLMVHRIEDDCWGAPGGKQNYSEPIGYTAVRETQEETGLVVGVGPVVGVTEWFNAERAKHYTMWWLGCRYVDNEQQAEAAVMEPTKHYAVKWVHLDTLPTLRLTEAFAQFIEQCPNWAEKVPAL